MYQGAQIVGDIGTNDVKLRMEQCAREGGYHIEEWLVPSATAGLRVACTMRIKGQKHGLGFRWDGEDINMLAVRCMTLDGVMKDLPSQVAAGLSFPWSEKH